MSAPILVVSEDVARNPVARAVARKRMTDAVRDFAITLHMLPEGAEVGSELTTAATVLATACRILHARGDGDTRDVRVMSGAISAIAQCSGRKWRWRALDLVPIDLGLQIALDVLRDSGAVETRQAWAYVENLK